MIKIRLYVHKSDYNQLVRVKPAMIKLIRSIGHSHADTHAINATPILLFLDLGQDGDGNGTLMQCACMTIAFHICRGVARGGGGPGGQSPPKFGRSVNTIQTRGADYAPHTTSSPPGFKKLSTPLKPELL